MRIAFYGSSLTSSYWNGAATYYRGIIRALAGLGYDITFYEPDAYDRQKNRDIDPPPWCRMRQMSRPANAIATSADGATNAARTLSGSATGCMEACAACKAVERFTTSPIMIIAGFDRPACSAR